MSTRNFLLFWLGWLCLNLTYLTHALSIDVLGNSSYSNDTDSGLDSSSGGYNATTNLTAGIRFDFEENPFNYVGSIDTSETFTRGEFANVGVALEACWQEIEQFYRVNVDSTPVPPGTSVVFYLNDWSFKLRWSPNSSPDPKWTRGVLDVAAKNLKTYFQNGEGRANNRHGLTVTTRFSNQVSIWLLEIKRLNASPFRLPQGGHYTISGNLYTRDRLAPNVCRALVNEVISWASGQAPGSNIPIGTWRTFIANDVSLRLYIGDRSGKPTSPINYREMAEIMRAFEAHLTGPGQPGWVGCAIFFGKRTSSKSHGPSGMFELAPGFLPVPRGPAAVVTAAVVSQVATS